MNIFMLKSKMKLVNEKGRIQYGNLQGYDYNWLELLQPQLF